MSPHGTRARYVVDGCRCPRCRAANTEYAWRRNHDPDWQGELIDPTEMVEHLDRLTAAGIGLRQVAAMTGLSRTTLSDLRSGRNRRVRRRTADAVLAVSLADHVSPRALTDSGATNERIEALRAAGMTRTAIAKALGYRTHALQITGRDRVTVRTARRVDVLYRLALREGLVGS